MVLARPGRTAGATGKQRHARLISHPIERLGTPHYDRQASSQRGRQDPRIGAAMSQTVLITGGSGFLGRRLAIALREKHSVFLGARNNRQNMAASEMTSCPVLPLDVSSIESVRDAVNRCRPDVIVHAAATKYVDQAEREPLECIDVNVLGSQNVARVAMERGVQVVVGISTDKAAPPVRNTYGLSKALMERMFCALDGTSDTRFLCVRYGNVAWSTGSVLPIWKRMHDRTGVIGTTGPEMRRFVFTVQEAVSLVSTALTNADDLGGRVVTREMKAAQIGDILDVWIERFGGSWERIDSRPGEREDEFLVGDLELPHTCERMIGGVRHFVISFQENVAKPPPVHLSSANAERLTRQEILSLIENPAIEEQ